MNWQINHLIVFVCKIGKPNEENFKKFRYLIVSNAFKNGVLNEKDIDQPVNYPLVHRL